MKHRALSTAPLWASAAIIFALVIVQAGRLHAPRAHAGDTIGTSGDFTLITTSSGSGPTDNPYDMLYVIDSHDGVLLLYEIENAQDRKGITVRAAGPIESLFAGVRR